MASGDEDLLVVEVPERDVIKFNLNVFMPYICDCVEAPILLANLTFYTKEQRKAIFGEYSRGRRNDATRKALDILIHDVVEPGRFTELRDAMETGGYPKIANILKGKYIPDDEGYRKIIELFTNRLTESLIPSKLLPCLLDDGVLDDHEVQEVRAEEVNHGRNHAAWILLFYLPARVEDWFKKFLTALIECKATDLAKTLDPDMFEKITAQRDFAATQDFSSKGDTLEHVMTEYGEASVDTLLQDGQAREPVPDPVYVLDLNHAKKKAENLESDHKPNKNDSKVNKNQHIYQKSARDISDGNVGTQMVAAKAHDGVEKGELMSKVSTSAGSDNDTDSENDEDDNIIFNNDFESDPCVSTIPDVVKESDEFNRELATALEKLRVEDEQAEVRNENIASGNVRDYKLINVESPNFDWLMFSTDGESNPGVGDKCQYSDDKDADFSITEVNVSEYGIDNTGEPVPDDEDADQSITEIKKTSHSKSMREDGSVNSSKKGDYLYSRNDTTQAVAGDEDIKYELHNRAEGQPQTTGAATASSVTVFDNVALKADDVGLAFDDIATASDDNRNAAIAILQGGRIKYSREFLLACQSSPFANRIPPEIYKYPEIVCGETTQQATGETGAYGNDMNIEFIGEASNDILLNYNIPTDGDVQMTDQDTEVQLRDYQVELAEDGCAGENVVVMAPTNTGKTHVAARIIQVHFKRIRQVRREPRAIFVVENEALAIQQGRKLAELLPAYRTKIISGTSQRDKKEYLKDFVLRRDILVVTAQVVVNTLKDKDIEDLSVFTLIVVDECHHANDYHPYNQIMRRYLDLKLQKDADVTLLPQIVGLTASLGVGGNLDPQKAMNHMKAVLANLDTKHLCTVKKYLTQMKEWENPPFEEIVTVEGRAADRYRRAVCLVMDKIEQYMSSHDSVKAARLGPKFCQVPQCRGTETFIQWVTDFKKTIAEVKSDAVRRVLSPCQRHLDAYNKALMVHEDARIVDAQAIVKVFMMGEEMNPGRQKVDDYLLQLYTDLSKTSFVDEPENPKLVKMQELLLKSLTGENTRGIIFVKTRELAYALVKWTHETNELRGLNAAEFIGQNASAAEGGMTKSSQRDTLDYFDDGKHKLVMATSVADEGLDITKCNLVIRYEHVTNEIVRLQSRGRARAPNSKYYVLTKAMSKIADKEEKNARLEDLMKILVPELQRQIEDNPNPWEHELRRLQEAIKLEEQDAEQKKKESIMHGDFELQCNNCGHFICMSSDVRKIKDSHHVVVDATVNQRVTFRRNPIPKFVDSDEKYDGDVFCGNTTCGVSVGGVCEYKHVEFPLLKIKQLRIVDKNGKGRTCKQWKLAKLQIQAITLEDLAVIVKQRRQEDD